MGTLLPEFQHSTFGCLGHDSSRFNTPPWKIQDITLAVNSADTQDTRAVENGSCLGAGASGRGKDIRKEYRSMNTRKYHVLVYEN
jgi:hypothetical protein